MYYDEKECEFCESSDLYKYETENGVISFSYCKKCLGIDNANIDNIEKTIEGYTEIMINLQKGFLGNIKNIINDNNKARLFIDSEVKFKNEKEINNNASEKPYIETTKLKTWGSFKYNKNYGDDRVCSCGHPYYRHFDSYENMHPVGCKYCSCNEFNEKEDI